MPHIICTKCFGGGWQNIDSYPLNEKQRCTVLFPCEQCKGKGRVELLESGMIRPIPDPKIQKGDDAT